MGLLYVIPIPMKSAKCARGKAFNSIHSVRRGRRGDRKYMAGRALKVSERARGNREVGVSSTRTIQGRDAMLQKLTDCPWMVCSLSQGMMSFSSPSLTRISTTSTS